jgi:hypothetical protein
MTNDEDIVCKRSKKPRVRVRIRGIVYNGTRACD